MVNMNCNYLALENNWAADMGRFTLKRIVFLLILSMPYGCSEEDRAYFPVAPGFEWRYRVKVTSSNGSDIHKNILRSLEPRLIDRQQTYIQASVTGFQTLYRDTEQGIAQIGYLKSDASNTNIIEDYRLLLPRELEQGSEWEGTLRARTLERRGGAKEDYGNRLAVNIPVTNRLLSTAETVLVPAGRFSGCIEIKTEGFAFYSGGRYKQRALVEIKQRSWYAPGVGLVKMVIQETSSDEAFAKGEWILELEAYRRPRSIPDFS